MESSTTGDDSESTSLTAKHGLTLDSYTALRLEHSSPAHLHLTTRRCFIGPIPEEWLNRHRKSWYKKALHISHYSSRNATFASNRKFSYQRRVTGLEGPSATLFTRSFPQPVDVDEEIEGPDAGEDGASSGGDDANQEVLPGLEEQQELQDVPGDEAETAGESPTQKQVPQQASSTRSAQRLRLPSMRAMISEKSTRNTESFVTAKETQESARRSTLPTTIASDLHAPAISAPASPDTIQASNASSFAQLGILGTPTPLADGTDSTVSLLEHTNPNQDHNTTVERIRDQAPESADALGVHLTSKGKHKAHQVNPVATRLVRFNIPENTRESRTSTRIPTSRNGISHPRTRRNMPGEVIKASKMLVRIDSTMAQLPDEFNENDCLKIDSRPVEQWREFVVICRNGATEDSSPLLQMYKTRVIPAIAREGRKNKFAHDIPLDRKITRMNMFSTLDKTIVIWRPWRHGTRMYLLRPTSSTASVEWYTFLQSTLGWLRPQSLVVKVPDLDLTIELENPFEALELASRYDDADETAIMKTIEAEKMVASNIILRCMKMVKESPLGSVTENWLTQERIGLAWKRFDRLEWVHGINEQKMCGTLAMQKTHDLELRPKLHYPTSVTKQDAAKTSLEEPAPIEGFLIRLTTQAGRSSRMGQKFFKRLYFSTHNQFLCFCNPAKAVPPPGPDFHTHSGRQVPGIQKIIQSIPLIYAVNPYPLVDGKIAWLQHSTPQLRDDHDQRAFKEAERSVNMALDATSYINLCHVEAVRDPPRIDKATEEAQVVSRVEIREEHREQEFQAEPTLEDLAQLDLQTSDMELHDGSREVEDRTFELVMKNGLIIRLQSFNRATKKEWMTRLAQLIIYWKLRIADDMSLYKLVRRMNLDAMKIDEEMESIIGQFGEKWEVGRSVASARLFNMCGISCCRAITMSGVLYRKPRLHGTFQKCDVVLCHGKLLVYQGTARTHTGKEISFNHHDREHVLDLKDTFIYSGLITHVDLLYHNQTFDSNHPGHHALPRIYLEDQWTSVDEDSTTCFVIWHRKSRSLFRSSLEDNEGRVKRKLRYVSALGVPGRSIVFKTRSRAERDHWVMSIGLEIERLQQGEDIRVVQEK